MHYESRAKSLFYAHRLSESDMLLILIKISR